VSDVVRHEASIIRRLSLDMTLDDEPRTTTEQIAESLSGVDWDDGYLFLGSDEGRGLERLESGDRGRYRKRDEFLLTTLFGLAGDPGEEADIESLSIHKDWLWLVTSHALTRPQLKGNTKDFAAIGFHPRRYVLGRIPLAAGQDGEPTPVQQDGRRRARCVPLSATGSALTDAIARDPYLPAHACYSCEGEWS
jgi:hypothetical protein